MSISVRFHIVPSLELLSGGQPVAQILSHFGDRTMVVEQLFGDRDGMKPSIKSKHLPEGSWLYNDEPGAESTEQHVGTGGEPLRYTTARQLAKLQMPEDAHPLDRAMMAYIKRLAKEAPETIIILELW